MVHASVFLDASRFRSAAMVQSSTTKLVNANDRLKPWVNTLVSIAVKIKSDFSLWDVAIIGCLIKQLLINKSDFLLASFCTNLHDKKIEELKSLLVLTKNTKVSTPF